MNGEHPIYPTIKVIPLDEIKPELERLYQRIDELAAMIAEQQKDPSQNDFLTTKQVIEQYPLSSMTLWRLDKRGELKPCRRTGGRMKIYRRRDIESFLEGK